MIVPALSERVLEAADALLRGELVGMPTETVYGIAASAFDPDAIQATFALKGRPADNPLIVHLERTEDWSLVASAFPPDAVVLAERFWPGPITFVLPKLPTVPKVATGGLDTVAIRVPAHPVARLLIAAAATPLTAPSANRFMSLSPTRAEDIEPSIQAGLFSVLDGGPCEIGIESTVVDLSDGDVTLLRPGGISRREIEIALGKPVLSREAAERRSPGQYAKHYAPNAPVRIVERLGPADVGIALHEATNADQIRLPLDPREYARELYKSLRELDRHNPEEILIEALPSDNDWEAIRDRIKRATSRG